MSRAITNKYLGTKGLSEKEIKEYNKKLKALRKAVNKETDNDWAEEQMYELPQGYRFFYQIWNPKPLEYQNLPKGIVFVFHGAYGSSDIFYPVADLLMRQGYLVVGFDYRGHGRTGGMAGGNLGNIDNFSLIFHDAHKLIKKFFTQYHVPIFFLGYDIGGLVAIQLANQISKIPLEGIILISPIWRLKQRIKHILLYPVVSIGQIFTKGETVQNVLAEKIENTYYEEYKEYSKNNPLRLQEMSFRMFKAILDLITKTHRLGKKTNYPCTIFQGTQDVIVDHFGVQKLYEKWKHPKKKIRLYENTGHNLLMDKFTHEIYYEIIEFVEELVPKK